MNKVKGFILPSPFLAMSGVALAFGISTIMFWRLYAATNNEYQAFRANVEQAQKQIEDDNRRTMARLAEEFKKTEQGWKRTIDLVNRSPRIRVQSCSNQGGMSPVSTATRLSPSAPTQLRFDPGISVAECEKRVNNAVQDAAQVVHLQSWILNTREASK